MTTATIEERNATIEERNATIEKARVRMVVADRMVEAYRAKWGPFAKIPNRLSVEQDRALRAYVRTIESFRTK